MAIEIISGSISIKVWEPAWNRTPYPLICNQTSYQMCYASQYLPFLIDLRRIWHKKYFLMKSSMSSTKPTLTVIKVRGQGFHCGSLKPLEGQ